MRFVAVVESERRTVVRRPRDEAKQTDGAVVGVIRRGRFFPHCNIELDAEDLRVLGAMLETATKESA